MFPFYLKKWRGLDKFKHFNIDVELVEHDNKALCTSYFGFIIGVGLIMNGGLTTGRYNVWEQLVDEILFTFIGFGCLLLSQVINDYLIMYGIDNMEEILDKKNLAVAVLEAGTYIATGVIYGRAVTSLKVSLIESVASTILWWGLCEIFLILFCLVYELITVYDDKLLIKRGKVAAAMGYSCSIVSLAIILSSPISKSDSLLAVCLSFIIGGGLLIVMRAVVIDKIVLHKMKLDSEISKDQNWGAALLEGAYALGFAIAFFSFYRLDGNKC